MVGRHKDEGSFIGWVVESSKQNRTLNSCINSRGFYGFCSSAVVIGVRCGLFTSKLQ